MSKDKAQLLSPLFLKYQADYEKNPRSRVFAPLAEIYRKLGMTDKAMEILAQGIRFHPTYVMGYLGLAFCYFDLRQFTLTYNTLRPLVETSRDNIRLQKLFADVCLELNYKEEALEAYKYLLFINPRDKEVSQKVSKLENLIEDQYKTTHQPIFIPESEFRNDSKSEEIIPSLFDVNKLENRPNSSQNDFDDWKAIDLSADQKKIPEEDPFDMWNLKKGLKLDNLTLEKQTTTSVSDFISSVVPQTTPGIPFKNNDDDIHLVLDDEEEDDESGESSQEIPMVTHTLVDLYCGQGHMEKALEVLDKILILNPTDQKTIKKIAEIKALMAPFEDDGLAPLITEKVAPKKEFTIPMPSLTSTPIKPLVELDDITEEDGRKNLMSILDQQLGHIDDIVVNDSLSAKEKQKKQAVEEKLTQFLKKIQKRALDYQARV